ncbi:MAG: thiol-disulfide oxidoreductase DCC family protein [Flavobacteriaceae bacterium]
MTLTPKQIILFDGVCNLCNSSIQYVIKHDKNDAFRFVAIQSNAGQALIHKHGIDASKTDSIILIAPNVAYYQQSDAVLKIAYQLNPFWNTFRVLEFIPVKLRNLVYNYVAKNRYKWYGKKENCMIPTPELKAKFLE